MNAEALQRIIDEVHATSAQQWLFRAVALLAALGAVVSTAPVGDGVWIAGAFVVGVLAAASAVRPDTHTALAVVVLVVWNWLASVDDVGTPFLPIAAVCLLVYHSVVALSASLPIGGTLPRPVLARWLRRTVLVGAATVALWATTALLDSRDAPGNGLLTALALAVLTAVAVMIRSRSLDQPASQLDN